MLTIEIKFDSARKRESVHDFYIGDDRISINFKLLRLSTDTVCSILSSMELSNPRFSASVESSSARELYRMNASGGFILLDSFRHFANAHDAGLENPCRFFRPEGAPVQIAKRPTGGLCTAGNWYLLSPRASSLFQEHLEGDYQPVLYEGKETRWTALSPRTPELEFIYTEDRREYTCRSCEQQHTADRGAAFLRDDVDLELAVDSARYGHEGSECRVFSSVEMAMELARFEPRHLGFDPVLPSDHPVAEAAIQIRAAVMGESS